MRRSRFTLALSALVLVASAAALFLPQLRPEAPPKKVSGAMQALDFWASGRAYPGRVIPDLGQALAFEQMQSMRSRNAFIDETTDPWTSMGPTNIGGRTLALALYPGNPDIIFAGSASGGLWRTDTGGVGAAAWNRIDTGHPVTSVSCIAIDETNPQRMYIGTGEVYRYQDSMGGEVIRTTRGSYGVGLLKTEDGGVTWSKSLDWSYAQQRGVWSVRIDPSDPQTLLAGTTEGVYRSTDAGASWNLVLDVIMVTDLRIHPADPQTIFAACGNFASAGHGIYRSEDGGDSWTQLTSGLPTNLSGKTLLDIGPAPGYAIYASMANDGYGRGLYRSTNGGDSWSQVSSVDYPRYQGWYAHYVVLSPFDAQTLFVGGIEIWRSTNGGSSLSERSDWTQFYFGTPPPEGPAGGPQYAHADHHAAVWHPTEPNTVFFASDGGVFKTTDLGNTFVGLNGGYSTTQFYNGFSSSGASPDLAMGGLQDNFTAIYEGGPAWKRAIGGDGTWTAMHPTNPSIMYGAWQYLNMLRSTNGGDNWSNVPPPDSGDQTAFVAPFVLSQSDPTTLYAGRSHVYRSNNSGSSWTAGNGGAPLDGNPILSLDMAASSPDTAYAGTAPINTRARVFRTVNGGASWQDVTGILPDRYPADIYVDRTNAAVVYVSFLGFGSSHLYRSEDAGLSWSDIGAGLPDIPTTAVATDPDHPEIIYAGTDLGIFVSPDGGANWQVFAKGMPTALVNDLKVYAPGRKLRTATHGNGAYERDLYDPDLTAVGDSPQTLAGLRVWPNPVSAGSRVHYELERDSAVQLDLYDVQGRLVARVDEGWRGAGRHSVDFGDWDLVGGVYFLRLEADRVVRNARVVYLRR
jgi:photosystem II stability/assembly factor-like uncharacterized protein